MNQIQECLCKEIEAPELQDLIPIPFESMKGAPEITLQWNPKCPVHADIKYDPQKILRIQEEKIRNAKPFS